jgi:hypothetical protein
MSETAGGCVYDGVQLDGVQVRIDAERLALGGATLAKGYRNPVSPDPFVEPGWFAPMRRPPGRPRRADGARAPRRGD